ncbi:MAG: serine/threonine protein kinase [Leptospiraceae bacterium]|nr:MAG: serine/threonine protein kinase [Leptospiraceae bacterium]
MDINLKELEPFLHKNQILNYKIKKITEEGSNRNYYRIYLENSTLILCITFPFLENQDDFILLTQYLLEKKAKIPNIIDYEAKKGWILLEDGGEYYLQDCVKKINHDQLKSIYKQIIDELILWHSFEDIPKVVKHRYFDQNKFQFEIDFCIDKLQKNHFPLPSFEFQIFLQEVIEFLCEQKEYVFTHRDFHSRNIIFKSCNSDFKIIDYQDARMGLRWYDLSSLLFDPYVQLNSSVILELFDYYYKHSKLPKNKKTFYLNLFYLQALQRLFKALGSFLYLGFELNKKHFLNYIIPDLEQMILLSHLGKFPDCIYLYCKKLLDFFQKNKNQNES